jgi:hypothetical protein
MTVVDERAAATPERISPSRFGRVLQASIIHVIPRLSSFMKALACQGLSWVLVEKGGNGGVPLSGPSRAFGVQQSTLRQQVH